MDGFCTLVPVEIVLDKTFACEGYETYYNYWKAHFLAYKRKTRNGLSNPDNHDFKNCLSDNLIAEYRKVHISPFKPVSELLAVRGTSVLYAFRSCLIF